MRRCHPPWTSHTARTVGRQCSSSSTGQQLPAARRHHQWRLVTNPHASTTPPPALTMRPAAKRRCVEGCACAAHAHTPVCLQAETPEQCWPLLGGYCRSWCGTCHYFRILYKYSPYWQGDAIAQEACDDTPPEDIRATNGSAACQQLARCATHVCWYCTQLKTVHISQGVHATSRLWQTHAVHRAGNVSSAESHVTVVG